MDLNFVRNQLRKISERMEGQNVTKLISDIALKTKNLKSVELGNQLLLGGILGSFLHQAYCDGRKLENPLPNGLQNNPRIKELNEPLDEEFIADVLSGEIPTSDTLYIKDGKVFMDIANTPFTQLSPHWQYDNFMAGTCAARSVITNWEGIKSFNPWIRKHVEIAVANGIHEAWIARGNVGDWNKDLQVAYINLSNEEQAKDVVHYNMAKTMITTLTKTIRKEALCNAVNTIKDNATVAVRAIADVLNLKQSSSKEKDDNNPEM